ncbi:hypothetical protein CCO03_09900 [Comamonas serinivorans]|uniref:HTH tetR-type domain-containing protein n=1 Tax=Comamonas serinivorans TaxID=1082851 RepID=A0A1Y0END5_9BURK|nr:TetR/AcrR family transcriptional regulator [Comamonas serinivorans]ARU04950.1 hypothetical protein CCO03_09900 [Comamonas serinivorans]
MRDVTSTTDSDPDPRGSAPADVTADASVGVVQGAPTGASASASAAGSGKGLETREHLKQVALQLFAERGVAQVSVRDILAAAGQRSGGALHYHFGGKEGLLRELIADAARQFDEARLHKLAALKRKRSPPTLRDVLRVLADPFDGAVREQLVPRGYGALLNALQVEHYAAFTQGVEGLDLGYRECIGMLRALLPAVPRQQLNQRIRLMMLFLFSAASARERATGPAQGEAGGWQQFWSEAGSKDTLLDCLEGMLTGPA